MLDVIIVGGGPAGLSAALVLGRCRRKVLVCDAGHPRNEASKAMHGFLSRDGMPPAEFLEVCRKQLERYNGVQVRKATVVGLERHAGRFEAVLESGERVSARTALLAMGISDECPDLEGFTQFYGSSVHHCPYCDGWEHRDEALAVYGCKTAAADLAVEVTLWSKDVVLCTGAPAEFGEEHRKHLGALGIPIVEEQIARLEGVGDQLAGVRFRNGHFLARRALFFSPGQRQVTPFGEKLGCTLDAEGAIECKENGATGAPGLYAAGNASRGLQLVIIAAGEGTQAAFAINQALLEADTA